MWSGGWLDVQSLLVQMTDGSDEKLQPCSRKADFIFSPMRVMLSEII